MYIYIYIFIYAYMFVCFLIEYINIKLNTMQNAASI